MNATILPTFKGYTVDMRLREFRKVVYDELPEFIQFDSPLGHKLLQELRFFAFQIIEVTKGGIDLSQEK